MGHGAGTTDSSSVHARFINRPTTSSSVSRSIGLAMKALAPAWRQRASASEMALADIAILAAACLADLLEGLEQARELGPAHADAAVVHFEAQRHLAFGAALWRVRAALGM